jgi:hypothetical protein
VVQFDDCILVQAELTQAPDGVGSGPCDSEKILNPYVDSGFALAKGLNAIAWQEDLAYLGGRKGRGRLGYVSGSFGLHPVGNLFHCDLGGGHDRPAVATKQNHQYHGDDNSRDHNSGPRQDPRNRFDIPAGPSLRSAGRTLSASIIKTSTPKPSERGNQGKGGQQKQSIAQTHQWMSVL